jgi:hypothetical protein
MIIDDIKVPCVQYVVRVVTASSTTPPHCGFLGPT